MPSSQLISQLFWTCNDCSKYASVTRCSFSCNLSRNVGKINSSQIAELMLHVAISGCNLQWVSKQCMQSMQKLEPSSTLCKPRKVARKVAKKACYMLQPTCNFSCNAIATKVAKEISRCTGKGTAECLCTTECRCCFKLP